MKRFSTAPLLGASIIALGSLLAACGGGGGGGSTNPPVTNPGGGGGNGGGGNPSPSASPSSSPGTPAPSPGATGSLATANGPLSANSTVVFTCACSGEAGTTTTTDANGSFSLPNSSTAIPASNTPYTLSPGRNYIVVGYQSGGTQAWTIQFLGNSPATNQTLSALSPTAQAAAALFVYYDAAYNPAITGGNHTFDWFDIRQVEAWAQKLDSASGLTPHEAALMADVKAQQQKNASLYPGVVPQWNPQSGAMTNPTITTDVKNIMSDGTAMDSALPTPCPAGPEKCSPTP